MRGMCAGGERVNRRRPAGGPADRARRRARRRAGLVARVARGRRGTAARRCRRGRRRSAQGPPPTVGDDAGRGRAAASPSSSRRRRASPVSEACRREAACSALPIKSFELGLRQALRAREDRHNGPATPEVDALGRMLEVRTTEVALVHLTPRRGSCPPSAPGRGSLCRAAPAEARPADLRCKEDRPVQLRSAEVAPSSCALKLSVRQACACSGPPPAARPRPTVPRNCASAG